MHAITSLSRPIEARPPNGDEAAGLVVNSLRGYMLDYLLAATDGRARMRAVDLEATVGYCVGGVERLTGAAALERS